ncbi:MAG: 5-formyltetrahydrofolate cyclo-ligase [Acidimicrobiia bacterium]|jgi:5-formyltetrahydrofolate cyclo-ligase
MEGLKRHLRRQARTLAPPTDAESAAVVSHLEGLLAPLRPSLVLTYLALPDEVDLVALVAALPSHRWAVTRTSLDGLTIHPLDSVMETHPFGIRQPVRESAEVPVTDVDVALVPGRLFGPGGERLGRGAGLYDGLLPSLRPEALRIGVTVERFVVDGGLPMGPHDVWMTHLVTEVGVRITQPRPPLAAL